MKCLRLNDYEGGKRIMKIIKSKKNLIIGICVIAFSFFVIFYVVKNFYINNDAIPSKDENKVEMIPGQKLQISKSLENVVWKSEDESIAAVTSDGVIEARNEGKVTVFAQTDKENYEYVIEVKEDIKKETEESQDDEVMLEKSFSETDNEHTEVINDTLPILEVDKVEAIPGEKTVELTISIKNNPGILGMSFNVNYDENALKLTKVKSGTAVENVLTFTSSKELSTGCRFVWDGTELKSNQIKDGDVLVLSFDVMDDAKEGKYSVDVSYDEGEIVDYKLIPVDMNIQNGNIYINE